MKARTAIGGCVLAIVVAGLASLTYDRTSRAAAPEPKGEPVNVRLLEELMNVQGIGEKRFLKLRSQLSIGGASAPAQQHEVVMAAFSVIELLFVLGVAATLTAVAVPQLSASLDEVHSAGAARHIAARLQQTRVRALTRARATALRIRADGRGYAITVYEDGNGNGVLAADIASGIDALVGPPERLPDLFSGVDFGALPGIPGAEGSTAPSSAPIRLGSGRPTALPSHRSARPPRAVSICADEEARSMCARMTRRHVRRSRRWRTGYRPSGRRSAGRAPEGHTLGPWVILVPVAGALVIVVMARHGSERIRGHGIPEAIEAILINGSRLDPKVAVLKPLLSAISIGSGGPFGAEGTIIMTGGDRIARRRGTKGGGTWSRAGKGRWARKSGRSGAALRRRGEVARRE